MFSGALYFVCTAKCHWASQVAQWLRIHLPMQEVRVRSLGGEDPLEEEMATSSSILAWKISWTEEAGGLQSMRSQEVRHDWAQPNVIPCEINYHNLHRSFKINDKMCRKWKTMHRNIMGEKNIPRMLLHPAKHREEYFCFVLMVLFWWFSWSNDLLRICP